MYILLFMLWMILNARITAETVAFGLVICGAIYWFMCRFLEYSPKNDIIFLKNLPRAIVYLAVLFVEIIKSSLIAMKFVYSKKLDIQPQIVFFDVPLKSEFLRTILANSITITPGTITVNVEDNHFCVHALDYSIAKGVEDSVFLKLLMEMEATFDD
ncbi:MAG: Na+/H+ antiporter subunit E [Oscillospiraceae bacterium]|nr:Na+/H+ antiporter subunit E [Oscillospiraceae bacterium]